jgi:hypothetical protein
MNPADEDHWTYEKLIVNPVNITMKIGDKEVKFWVDTINIPYGENEFIEDAQRELVKIAYKDRPDLYRRYVEGKFSFIQVGEAVTPEYNERLHRSEYNLNPSPDLSTFRFWDGGLNPTCVSMQITPRGRFFFTDCVRGENIGVKQLIRTQIKPLIKERYSKIKKWRDIGDPSMMNREQSDSSQTAAEVINKELNAAFERGEIGWASRREVMKEIFNRMVDGSPQVQISRHLGNMHRCFRGGWHYHRDAGGRILRDKAVKDIHSHIGDAVGYGIAKIRLLPRMQDRLKRVKKANERRHGRMM